MEWIIPILSIVLGGGGIWALLSAKATSRAVERAAYAAAQATERAAYAAAQATERAAEAAATPATHAASTADWTALMTFWQGELTAVRDNASRLEVRLLFLEQQREDDLAHIENLEHHIWQQLPPPPPLRRRTKKPDEAP